MHCHSRGKADSHGKNRCFNARNIGDLAKSETKIAWRAGPARPMQQQTSADPTDARRLVPHHFEESVFDGSTENGLR